MPSDSSRPDFDSARIKSVVGAQYPQFLADLELITNIDSGTGDRDGSARIAGILKERIETLGGTVEFRTNSRGTHVIARFAGAGRLRVLLSPHTDTVFEAGEAQRRPFRTDANGYAYGPGVGDCKASVVQMIYLMKSLRELAWRDYGEIIIYFDAEEEGGSEDELSILRELAGQVDVALIVDTARPGWGIVTQRKGSARYEIRVEGISGHAGNAPQSSASAVMELGHLITALYRLASPLPGDPGEFSSTALEARGIHDHGQFVPETSINVGVISTPNTRVNRIPDNASAEVEVRTYKMAELNRLDREIRALVRNPVVPGACVTIEGGITKPPMEKTPGVERLVALYKSIVQDEYGADVVEWSAGGVTVGNETAKYVPTLDALGVDTDPTCEHTEREYVDLKTFAPRTVALVQLLRRIAGEMAVLAE